MELIKVPLDRIPALIGKQGRTRKMLEKKLQLKLSVSDEGEVKLEGEPLQEFLGREVVKAVACGFPVRTALKLLDDSCTLKVVNLREWGGGSPKGLQRVKARLIGSEGKTKRLIEEIAEADLCIHGHTVAIIGDLETIDIAVQAVFKLLEGASHGAVYGFLERARHSFKEKRLKEGFW